MEKKIENSMLLVMAHLKALLGQRRGFEVYREIEDTIRLVISAAQIEEKEKIVRMFQSVLDNGLRCPSCGKEYIDSDNLLHIYNTGECMACEHVRGETLDDALDK